MKLILLMAVTVDGMIARDDAHFPDWTGRADKRLFVEITKAAGVIIVGSKTFDTIGKPLPGRLMVVMTRNRRRRSRWDNLIFTDRSPAELLADLERRGYREAVLAGGATINDLFAHKHLIDEIRITVSPLIFGRGITLFNTHLDLPLKLRAVQPLEGDLVHLIYDVPKPDANTQPAS